MIYYFSFISAFVLSIIFTFVIKQIALSAKIVDIPKGRKIHNKPTPLLGGTAIYLSFTAASIFFYFGGHIADKGVSSLELLAILIAGAILIIGGALDDVYNLPPYYQILFPLGAILITLYAGVSVNAVTNPSGGVLVIPMYFGLIFSGIWLLVMMYTTKLLDGLDGLLSGVTVIGSSIIFIVSLFWDKPLSGTSVMAMILAGASAGFLVFNWHPAKIFLGEGGSVICGYFLGVLSIITGSKIATTLLIMGIPMLDVAWVVWQRFRNKKSFFSGDRSHFHFRLLSLGLSHRQTVLLIYLTTALFGIISLFLNTLGKVIEMIILLLLAFILLTYLTKRNSNVSKA